jgi:hypothetical protein
MVCHLGHLAVCPMCGAQNHNDRRDVPECLMFIDTEYDNNCTCGHHHRDHTQAVHIIACCTDGQCGCDCHGRCSLCGCTRFVYKTELKWSHGEK